MNDDVENCIGGDVHGMPSGGQHQTNKKVETLLSLASHVAPQETEEGRSPGRNWNDSFVFPRDDWNWWNRPSKQRSKRTRVQSDGGGGSPLTIRPSGPREQFLLSRWAKSLELGKRRREPKWLQGHSPH